MDEQTRDVLKTAVKALADFKRIFGRDLTPSLLAEMYTALDLDLRLPDRRNEPGFDLVASDGMRYQVKQRDPETLNVDINNFDFDYLVLVNLDVDYGLLGMWKLDVERAREIFRFREKFRKYQATQKVLKEAAQRIFPR